MYLFILELPVILVGSSQFSKINFDHFVEM
jgi:hypothetical protein